MLNQQLETAMKKWLEAMIESNGNFVLAVVGGKGGLGKTTFSYNFLWLLVKYNIPAVLVDCDNGQNSSAEFAADRKAANILPEMPVIAMPTEQLSKALPKLAKEFRVIIIEFGKTDNAESAKRALELAIKLADKIVMPLQPTAPDVKTIPSAEENLIRLNSTVPAFIVPNRVKKESQLNVIYGVRSFLKCFKVTKTYLGDRLCYQDSLGFDGRSIFELNGTEPKKAQHEFIQLFEEILND
jgi:cellulose biosynthesis protein BcsQ